MDDKIVFYPVVVHQDFDKAKLGVMAAAEALDVKCDCSLATMWVVFVGAKDQAAFLSLAQEEANAI